MGETIIANNCVGHSFVQDLGIRYNSPTVALQILPEEFPKFCKDLKTYMDYDLVSYTDFSSVHAEQAINMFGHMPSFPCALCGDVVIYFQHYKTFEEAKDKWDRRRQRVDYEHLGFLFHLNSEKYADCAREFAALGLKNSAIFTEGFGLDIENCYRFDLPKGKEFLGRMPNGKRYFEENFDRKAFIKGVRQ